MTTTSTKFSMMIIKMMIIVMLIIMIMHTHKNIPIYSNSAVKGISGSPTYGSKGQGSTAEVTGDQMVTLWHEETILQLPVLSGPS